MFKKDDHFYQTQESDDIGYKGHLHPGNMNFGPGNILISSSYSFSVLERGKEHLSWVLKPCFNLHSGDTLATPEILTNVVVQCMT